VYVAKRLAGKRLQRENREDKRGRDKDDIEDMLLPSAINSLLWILKGA
jgi:hypothetical protein